VRFKRFSDLTWRSIAREGLAMKRSGDLTWAQVLMAANTPMLLKAAMVDGRPDAGVMASGQVVGVIEDLPSVDELKASGLLDTRPAMAVLPTDSALGQGGSSGAVVLGDLDALVDWWAERLVAAAAPLIEAIRGLLPFGRRCLWGGLADRVAYPPLALARRMGRDGAAAWAEATALIDALARHAPVRFARPKPFVVGGPCGEVWFSVKGTCCLRYRTAFQADPCGASHCNSCPILDDAQRLARWRAHLQIPEGDALAVLRSSRPASLSPATSAEHANSAEQDSFVNNP
jgi:hypothetical protein